MTPIQAAAFVQAQAALCLVELEAMKAANGNCFSGTSEVRYTEVHFRELQARYESTLGYNAVIGLYQDAARYE